MGAVCCRDSSIDFTEEVRLAHFDLLRCVGKGAFGKVRIVQHKANKQNYALKYINKEKCIRMKAIDNIIQERRILEEIKFPLICNLRYAFQDDENMFMVLDLMLGGDLRFHVDRKGSLSEEVIRLWAAEIIVSLHYLHSKRFVHRDIKPDNVLLDSQGHAHLTDFNIAVRIKPGKKLTSVAGSLAYMAPEILQRMGYTFSVDWWSTGVLLYEMLFGQRPFRAKSNDELARLILQKPITFPDKPVMGGPVSDACKEVLLGLCERNIHKRLGFGESNYRKLINHRWFEGINWDQVARKEIKPLFVPDAKHSNFDATHELEELLMEDTPLRVNNRSKNPKPLSTEMQKIENEFTNYDHTRTALSNDNQLTDIDPPPLTTPSLVAAICIIVPPQVMPRKVTGANYLPVPLLVVDPPWYPPTPRWTLSLPPSPAVFTTRGETPVP
ncbi:kinase-like domain-containing protein [Dimargaris cristalligena]|uniref:Kinase-like domain-containing protein n=1 Tax=Dimargaris cristalligena TaxID=215637 RepID=A0A4P9ZQH5_9FUNG|nr:kinase-like domain-containing protein [Dimargaris cristalligena]|eukprot:RKP34882.1 kinase-like domain-containing protein [Dimargaris cristalligena]